MRLIGTYLRGPHYIQFRYFVFRVLPTPRIEGSLELQRTLLYIDLIRTLIQVASITEQVFATQEHVT